jgi:hypothetical protein
VQNYKKPMAVLMVVGAIEKCHPARFANGILPELSISDKSTID